MNIVETLHAISAETAKKINKAKAAYWISKKFEKIMPEYWHVEFVSGWEGCLFMPNWVPLSSEVRESIDWMVGFKLLRGYLKTMFPDKEWKMESWSHGAYLFALHAGEYVKVNGVDLKIEVRQTQTKRCKFEVVEEMTKTVKVVGDCGKVLDQV